MPGPGPLLSVLVVAPRQAALALVVAGMLWIGVAGSALALDLTVDTIIDTTAAQACTGNPNDCSLRGAILRANAATGPHTITVPAGTYTQVLLGTNEDAGQTGDWDIKQTITINGVGGVPGSTPTTIFTGDTTKPRDQRDRIFHVLPGGNLTLRDVQVNNGGNEPDGSSEIFGGGVRVEGPLTLERVQFGANRAPFGGGLSILAATTIRDSTFYQNSSGFAGGALDMNFSPSPYTVAIQNTTFYQNQAGTFGGAILAGLPANSSLILNNVSIVNNVADQGGGIHAQGSGQVRMSNTLIANNIGLEDTPNCHGIPDLFISQGYNLVFGGDSCGFSAGNQDQVNTGDPHVGGAFETSGSTGTLPLGYDSAATDRGNPAPPGSGGNACVAVDQRGIPRTVDGNSDGVGRCDVGAAEGGLWLPVDTTIDSNAGGFQVCDASLTNGNCSLRGAITRLRSRSLPHIITLPATGPGNPYRLTLNGAGTDDNATGDLDVINDVTIVGGGAATTIVDGNQLDRVFHLLNFSSAMLRLQDLTVQNGNAGSGPGGGIFAEQKPVSLLRVRLRANTAQNGGGIFFLTIGGTIADSVVSDNRATGTIQGGGGITQSSGGTVQIRNSTIAQNRSDAGGGGIAQFGSVTTQLRNTTVAENSAEIGGGLFATSAVNTLNSIIANNRLLHAGPFDTNPNCGGPGSFNTGGHNLVFGGDTCGFIETSDKQNQDPKLQPLQNNGGPTETMALGGGSAAIDAGNPATPGEPGNTCSATDQRGTPRPVDGDAVGGARCDIGAYEAAFCTSRPANVTTAVAPGTPGRLTVTVRAGYGNIRELRLHPGPLDNIVYNVGAGDQSGERVVPINAPTKTFTIKRANGTGAGTLKFDVVDDCGTWKTLAGGGPNAWPAGTSAVDEAPADDAQRTAPSSATATPSSTPGSPSTTPVTAPPSCSPRRPDVGVSTVKSGPGQLRATLTAQTLPGAPPNSLHSVRIRAINHADVTLNGTPVTTGQSVTLPGDAREATLTITRHGAADSPNPTAGVAFVVTDDCGEWSSFVGGGAGAF